MRGRTLLLVVLAALSGCAPPPADTVAADHPADAPSGRLGAILGGTEDAGFARAGMRRAFDFPADHGAHPAYRSEWWYLVFALEGPAGERYGAQFTLFRQALHAGQPAATSWSAGQLYMGHAALTDVSRGRHWSAQRFARALPGLAGVTLAPFRAEVDGWVLAGTTESALLPAELRVRAEDFALDLTLDGGRGPVLQGDAGLSRKGPGQASYYYSMPRIQVRGRVLAEQHWRPVSGRAWLDREWSTSVLGDGQLGWDWFALMLDDGRDLMAFQLRRRDGQRDPYDHAVWMDASGGTRSLDAGRFTLTPERYWRDDAGTAWPVRWRLDVDGESLWVEAVLDDQRMDTWIRYWEGLVVVRDAVGRPLGEGYLEMTGYEPATPDSKAMPTNRRPDDV